MTTGLSETFDAALNRVDLNKYIDEIEVELGKISKDVGPGRTDAEIEAGKKRIEDLIRRQAAVLAKETGTGGNYVFVHMLMSSVLTTAWASFATKRGILDLQRPFEDRLRLEELLGSLGLALSAVISKSAEHADMYGKK